jgi:integral membrane protein (TIGR01906 family)
MAGVTGTLPQRLAGLATSIATAIVIVAIAILPFLTPAWVSFEQGRTGVSQLTGYSTPELRVATDAILADLVIGPPDFDVAVNGEAVLNERERAHMRDVRGVFGGFGLVAVASVVLVVAAVVGANRLGHPERAWRAIRAGAIGLAIGVVVGGFVALVAFDVAFEIFHRLFFAGGTYTFDPGTERLVQLFPFAFWSETTIAVGGVVLALSAATAFVAGRRIRRGSAAHVVDPGGDRAAGEPSRVKPEAAR